MEFTTPRDHFPPGGLSMGFKGWEEFSLARDSRVRRGIQKEGTANIWWGRFGGKSLNQKSTGNNQEMQDRSTPGCLRLGVYFRMGGKAN